MRTKLTAKSCTPCETGGQALHGEALAALAAQVPTWEVVEEHHLLRGYRFRDFATALAFVNQIGAVAEAEQHHPDIALAWGKVEVTTYTHSIGGLSENDFILAAKIDALH